MDNNYDPEKVIDKLIADGWPIMKWYENGEPRFMLVPFGKEKED